MAGMTKTPQQLAAERAAAEAKQNQDAILKQDFASDDVDGNKRKAEAAVLRYQELADKYVKEQNDQWRPWMRDNSTNRDADGNLVTLKDVIQAKIEGKTIPGHKPTPEMQKVLDAFDVSVAANKAVGQAQVLAAAKAAPAPAAAPAETQVAQTNPPSVDEIKGKAKVSGQEGKKNIVRDDGPTVVAGGEEKKESAKDGSYKIKSGDTLSHIALSSEMKAAYAAAEKALAGISGDTHSKKEKMDLVMVAIADKTGIKDLNKIRAGDSIAQITEEDVKNALGKLQLAGKIENGHLALGKGETNVAEITTPKTPQSTQMAQGRIDRSV